MGKLNAGAGKKCITPPETMFPALSFLDIEFEGVYRNLYVRVLILADQGNDENKVALITYDAADMGRTKDICEILEKKFGFKEDQLQFAATHSHEAPTFADEHEDVCGIPEKRAWAVAYGDFVIERTVEAFEEALGELRPAKLCFKTGKSYINVCRDELFEDGTWGQGMDFEGPADKTLSILLVRDLEDRIIAGYLNYAVHGTCCFMKMDQEGKKFLIAGDLPGMTSEYLEERYESDHAVFLWTSGPAGNVNPIFFCAYYFYHHDKTHKMADNGYQAWMMCESLAQRHAVDAIKIINQMTPKEYSKEFWYCEKKQDVVMPGRILVKEDGTEGTIIPGDHSVQVTEKPGPGHILKLRMFCINDVTFLSMNAELVAEIGLRLKAGIATDKLVIVTHAGERIGYIPDKKGYERRTFAYYTTRIMGGVGEELMTPVVYGMFERLKEEMEQKK